MRSWTWETCLNQLLCMDMAIVRFKCVCFKVFQYGTDGLSELLDDLYTAKKELGTTSLCAETGNM